MLYVVSACLKMFFILLATITLYLLYLSKFSGTTTTIAFYHKNVNIVTVGYSRLTNITQLS